MFYRGSFQIPVVSFKMRASRSRLTDVRLQRFKRMADMK
jgi:hypothetical protein